MPPTDKRQLIRNDIRNERIKNTIATNNNTPPPDILYRIVQQSTPNEESNRELRRINREARMKQNQLNREARQIQNKPPPIKTADDIAEKELRRINR